MNTYYTPYISTTTWNPNLNSIQYRTNTGVINPNNIPEPSNNFVWVQGESGAKAYPVAPGNRVLLMDSENPVIYIKSADMNGRPMEMEVYDMVRRQSDSEIKEESKDDMSIYVKRDEIEELIESKTKEILKKNRNKKGGD